MPPARLREPREVYALQVLLIGAMGAVGTLLRYWLSRAVGGRLAGSFPWGTFVINLSGAFVLGALTGAGAGHLPDDWRLALGTGLIGGYTTFSTLTWESLNLIRAGQTAAGLVNLFTSAALGLLAAALGVLAGHALWP